MTKTTLRRMTRTTSLASQPEVRSRKLPPMGTSTSITFRRTATRRLPQGAGWSGAGATDPPTQLADCGNYALSGSADACDTFSAAKPDESLFERWEIEVAEAPWSGVGCSS